MLSGPPVTTTLSADQLIERFISSATRQRRTLLQQVLKRSNECRPLIADQIDRWDATGDDWACGTLIQLLVGEEDALAEAFWARYPEGWLAVTSGQGLDYTALQQALIRQDFEEADRLTSEHLRQLGPAPERSYVYSPKVPMATVDLQPRSPLGVLLPGPIWFFRSIALAAQFGQPLGALWPRLAGRRRALGPATRKPSPGHWMLQRAYTTSEAVARRAPVFCLLSHPGVQQHMRPEQLWTQGKFD